MVRRHAQGHTKKLTYKTEVPRFGKTHKATSTFGCSCPGTSRTTIPEGVAAIHPEMLKSLKPDSFFLESKQLFEIVHDFLSHQAGNRLYFLLLIHKY